MQGATNRRQTDRPRHEEMCRNRRIRLQRLRLTALGSIGPPEARGPSAHRTKWIRVITTNNNDGARTCIPSRRWLRTCGVVAAGTSTCFGRPLGSGQHRERRSTGTRIASEPRRTRCSWCALCWTLPRRAIPHAHAECKPL